MTMMLENIYKRHKSTACQDSGRIQNKDRMSSPSIFIGWNMGQACPTELLLPPVHLEPPHHLAHTLKGSHLNSPSLQVHMS